MINIDVMMKDISTILYSDKYRDAVNEELLQDIKEAILKNVKTITGRSVLSISSELNKVNRDKIGLINKIRILEAKEKKGR